MCIVFCRFLCQCLSPGFFVSATVHTTLPLTSPFLITLAVQFLCVLFSAVYVYMCMCMCMYMYMCVECVWKDGERTESRAKSGETLVEASRDTNAQIVRYTFFMGANDKSNHLTAGSLQRFTTITVA